MSTLGKIVNAATVTAGLVGAAVLGGATAQRVVLQRYRELDQVPGWGPSDGFGTAGSDRSYSVAAPDGVALHVEEVGPLDAPLTVIFSHGWTLQLGAWYFQRTGLAGRHFGDEASAETPSRAAAHPPQARLVFYDQRSHGRSSRAPRGHSTIADLAADLDAVIATAAPTGPIALVGHSMGGMATLALAAGDPALFAERVVAVALLSTSADETVRGGARLLQVNGSNPLLPLLVSAAGRYPRIVERGRGAGQDAIWLLTRSLGFADPAVPAPLVDYLDQMISATPVDVIAEFSSALFSHDQRAGLQNLAGIPVLIAVGEKDRMTPPSRSRAMAEALPEAELLVIPQAGHMAIMERADEINAALRRLLRAGLRLVDAAAPHT